MSHTLTCIVYNRPPPPHSTPHTRLVDHQLDGALTELPVRPVGRLQPAARLLQTAGQRVRRLLHPGALHVGDGAPHQAVQVAQLALQTARQTLRLRTGALGRRTARSGQVLVLGETAAGSGQILVGGKGRSDAMLEGGMNRPADEAGSPEQGDIS